MVDFASINTVPLFQEDTPPAIWMNHVDSALPSFSGDDGFGVSLSKIGELQVDSHMTAEPFDPVGFIRFERYFLIASTTGSALSTFG